MTEKLERAAPESRTRRKLAAAWLLIASLALGVAAGTAFAQQPSEAQKPQQAPTTQQPKGASSQAPTSQTAPAERKLSQKEADELFRSVDEILEFVSKDTGLPIKQKVKRQLASRDEVVKYVQRKLDEDEDTQRLERSAVSLKKFGLLPPGFELRPYLLELLKEQVAGFYDSKTKTVYLLDWVEPEAQKPVLAHELTHALQDQNFDLEKWGKGPKSKADADIVASDEESSAKQAVIEGQAMITLLDYSLAPVGGSVLTSPEIVEAMKAGMVGADAASPLYSKSPLFLKEALIFPYRDGIDFVRAVLVKRGRQGAFAGTMEHPPVSSRQIIMPQTYLDAEKIPPVPVPDIDKLLGKEYERYDFGGIGQFDIGVMIEQWMGAKEPSKVASAWRGGYYWVGRKAGVKEGPAQMVFVTRWASPQDAQEFASVYGKAVAHRYKNARLTKAMQNGRGEWDTEEGPVRMETAGDMVVAVEGFETGLSGKLLAVTLPAK